MSSPEVPPLPAWPAFAYEQEPAHGYFQRLAMTNGVVSTRGLAEDLGLNGRNLNVAELLEFCRRFPMRGCEHLVQATPVLTEHHAHIAGQEFRRVRDWSLRRPRVCPGCLAEAPFHRTWFDLTSVEECPFHGVTLVEGFGEERLNWFHPTVGEVPHTGISLAANHPRIPPPTTWERYLLGRLGYIEPWSISFLDDVELYHIIDAADLLGTAAKSGWRADASSRRQRSVSERRGAVRAGFTVLTQGPAGVVKSLEAYADGSPLKPEPRHVRYASYIYWGWLNGGSAKLPESKLASLIRLSMDQVAGQRGVLSRKAEGSYSGKVETLYKLAPVLGVSVTALRTVALKLGLTERLMNKSQFHAFDATAVETLKGVFDDLIVRAEAEECLGEALDHLEGTGQVAPIVRMGGTGRECDYFRKSELMARAHPTAQPATDEDY